MAELPTARLEIILGLTAFAAGAVDVISFAKLGGILASAMTGNLAFLGFYLSRGSFASAVSSMIALAGFVAGSAAGTLLSRTREPRAAIRALLGVECLLLTAAGAVWLPTHHRNGSLSGDAVILLLAISMGIQSITGKRLNLSNVPTIVFTSTLTNIVMAVTGMVASGKAESPEDTRRQIAAFLLYFLGALGAGFAVYGQLGVLICMPLAAVGVAASTALRP